MTRLIIWRHGRTEWNATDRVQGQTDVDLDETGVVQAQQAAPRIAVYHPILIVSSDLRRAVRTADALAAITGLGVDYDPRLQERNYGPWEGLTLAEIEDRYPAEYARWRGGGRAATPTDDPAIETTDELAKRATAAFRDAAERAGGGTAVVVTHGGTARVGCAGLLGWPPAAWHTLGGLGNCRYAELRHTSVRGWQLRSHNVG
jgi:probable phosphoglycerate mutase